MVLLCLLCDKRISSRAKVYGHFRHYHHVHFDQCVHMLLADGFVLDPTVSVAWTRLRAEFPSRCALLAFGTELDITGAVVASGCNL